MKNLEQVKRKRVGEVVDAVVVRYSPGQWFAGEMLAAGVVVLLLALAKDASALMAVVLVASSWVFIAFALFAAYAMARFDALLGDTAWLRTLAQADRNQALGTAWQQELAVLKQEGAGLG